jgi:NAD(P)-dependent dehydrogenase (short-subunit alcohol dehydrogenase family)
MKGKVCLITGATSGIGEVTALELARQGFRVVITARSQAKLETALDKLSRQSGSQEISGLVADFSSQREVRSLVKTFMKEHDRLDVLINNAGAVYLRRTESVDGIEMTFAVNHLSYFLLTNLLIELLKASAPARIVNVASNAHKGHELDFGDLQCQHNYQFMRAYGKSKLANIMFTYELDRRLVSSGVTVNALHPGFVATNIGGNNGWLVRLFLPLLRIWAISPEEGAKTSIYLASSPDVKGVSGKYFYNKHPTSSSKFSYNAAAARKLWDISAELTGIHV